MSETPTPEIVRTPGLTGLVSAFRNYAAAAADGDPNVAEAYAHCASLLVVHVDRLLGQNPGKLNAPDLRARLALVEADLGRARTDLYQATDTLTAYAAAIGVDPSTLAADEIPDDVPAAIAAEREHLRDSHQGACNTVAAMHEAATGRRGQAPRRGVIEDVQDVAGYAAAARAALAKIAADLDELPRLPAGERKARREALAHLCRELADSDPGSVLGDPRAEFAADLLYDAWAVIANTGVHRGNWESQHPEWVAAAERWRDRWHAFNSAYCDARQAAGLIFPVNPNHPGPEPAGPAPVDPEALAMLPELAHLADDPAAQPHEALLRDLAAIAGQFRGLAYDPCDRPEEILAVRRAAYRVGLVPFPSEQAPPRGYRGAVPPVSKTAAATVTNTTAGPLTMVGPRGRQVVTLLPGDSVTVTAAPEGPR